MSEINYNRKLLDIGDIRKRYANSIKNTQVGRYLGMALDELQMLRDREESIKANRAVSSNLLEIAAEQRDPAKWAAMMIIKGGNPQMTSGEAMDLIEGTLRHALELMMEEQKRQCDEQLAKIGQAFLDDFSSENGTPCVTSSNLRSLPATATDSESAPPDGTRSRRRTKTRR